MYKKILGLFLFAGLFINLSPFESAVDRVFAEEFTSEFPYIKTFTISAYYSPLPCQDRYVTGSYEGDIKLNGYGVHGADGTDVYPGMIAAPKSYVFGTKMHIPGIGVTAVHDRGGAILASNGVEGVYDRLDVWMGYGDNGLNRALNWGKKTIDVAVYGVEDSLMEEIELPGFSPDEKIANLCEAPINVPEHVNAPVLKESDPIEVSYLQLGSNGYAVKTLQSELKKLNYFKTDITGYFGPVTENAVYKFQQAQKLVLDKSSLGAGIFGPVTKDRLNEIIASRNYTEVIIAETTNKYNVQTIASKKDEDLELISADSRFSSN